MKTIKFNKIKNIFFFDQVNSIELLYHCDIVVGMFSNILIEASIFNKVIIRHLPIKNFRDPLSDLKNTLVSRNKKKLDLNFKEIL